MLLIDKAISMKKLLNQKAKFFLFLLAITCIYTNKCVSQSFALNGSEWDFCSSSGPVFYQRISKAHMDSTYIHENKTINVVKAYYSNSLTPEWFHFHVSGDSTFVYTPMENKYTLVFNFSFQLGDTLTLNRYNTLSHMHVFGNENDCDTFLTMIVDSVSNVQIGGQTLRFYKLKVVSHCAYIQNASLSYFFLNEYKLAALEKVGYLTNDLNNNIYSSAFIIPEIIDHGFVDTELHFNLSFRSSEFDIDFNNLLVCEVTSNRNKKANPFQIYPNPIRNNFSIETSDDIYINQIKIYNLSGQEVYSEAISKRQAQINLSLPNLPNGMYVVNIQTELGVMNKKINVVN